MKPSRLSRWAATALLALACQDHRPLTSPPSFLIQDAAHSGGNPHVYWLPPMEAQPKFTGTFNGTLSPVIEISELPNAAKATCGAQGIIATFTTSTGPGGGRERGDDALSAAGRFSRVWEFTDLDDGRQRSVECAGEFGLGFHRRQPVDVWVAAAVRGVLNQKGRRRGQRARILARDGEQRRRRPLV